MAYTPDRLYGGALTTTTTTVLVTAGASEKLLVKQALLCNTGAIDISATLYLAGVHIASSLIVPAGSTVDIPLTQILRASETITGGASGVGIDCVISGIRIT